MSVKRVNPCQLSIGHINAPERQKLADDLAEEILRKGDQLHFTQLRLEDELYRGKRSSSWGQRRQLKALQAREAELEDEIRKLEENLCQLGGHPKFRTPVVEGYGLADALRRLRN